MATYIALLRGINVGGHKMVSMAGVRAKMTAAGYSNVRTLLQSGNVVFEGRKPKGLDALLGTDVLIRTAGEWRSIVERNPFPKEAKADPAHLVVMCLRDPPASLDSLVMPARERASLDASQLYLYYPDGQGTSKLTNALIEKKLATRGTARNWNTTLKLLAML